MAEDHADLGDEPMDILTRLTFALEAMAARQTAGPATAQDESIIEKLTAALDRLSANQIAGSKLIADETRRAHRPSNEVVPMRSEFNPRGVLLENYQKPKLKCVMMVPWLLDNDSLTREEVELMNLLEPGTFTIKRIDGTKVQLDVTVTTNDGMPNGKPSRLVINNPTAFKNEVKSLMPALTDICRQMLKQSPNKQTQRSAAAVLTMDEECALIESGELLASH